MSKSWTDLYKHGQNLNSICKKAFSEFKKAEEEGNDSMMLSWAECLRKTTMNCTDIAKTVLAVEEIVKGKRVN